MENVYVARQPIFDKNKAIYGYELLFRDGTANCVPDIDGDEATQTLLANTFFTIGMDTLSGGRRSFVNFTQNLLEKKVPLLLPRDRVVVEILEDVAPTPALIDACTQMVADGYTIALDDFVYTPDLDPLIAMAQIIKFDFRLTPKEKIDACLKQLPANRYRLLAEKVETHDEFTAALQMGFELFQGYFFCKPEVIQGSGIRGNQLNLMTIMTHMSRASIDWDEMEGLIARDMGISYKLLKYLNSTYFGRASKVSSVKQALVYLGEKELRRFVSLIAMSKLAEGKPNELIRAACIRGRFCELVAAEAREATPLAEMFTLGMFSLIDAVMDCPMAQVLKELPLVEPIKQALTESKGRLAGYIELACAYESGRWDRVGHLAADLHVADSRLPALYLSACKWSDSSAKAA